MTLVDLANKLCSRLPLYYVKDDFTVIEVNKRNLSSISLNYIFYKDKEGDHFVSTTDLVTKEEIDKEINKLKKKKSTALRRIREKIERLQQIEKELQLRCHD